MKSTLIDASPAESSPPVSESDSDSSDNAPSLLLTPAVQPSFSLDSNNIPIPHSLSDLVLLIRQELGSLGLMDDINLPRLSQIVDNYRTNDWESYAFFDNYRYTRNLVDDGNGRYNLLLLCWGAGMKSPIHDHAGSHCLLKVVDGDLVEERFEWPDSTGQEMALVAQNTLPTNTTGYMHDKIGLHRISNASNRNAVSLHLYSPPITICKTFNERTSEARESGNCVFYSVRGEKTKYSVSGLGKEC